MARLQTMLIILICIQFCLILYSDQTVQATDTWELVTNSANWNNTTFILSIIGIAGSIGLVGIVAGSIFGFKTDFIIFAIAIPGLISLGLPFVNLYNVLSSEITSRFFPGCGVGIATGCNITNLILATTLGAVFVFYVFTVIDWWRNRDM